MRIIEVLNMIAEGKIKEGTKFILNDDLFIFNGGVFGSGFYYLENCMFLKEEDLNQEVELIPPKPKKYYLRLDEDDSFSYINLTMYAAYEAATKDEFFGYKTKFTQEEIDGSIFLKFIEQHGIKEEVDEDEND